MGSSRFKLRDGSYITVTQVERHRNGSGGDGFYAVKFWWEDHDVREHGDVVRYDAIGIVTDSSFIGDSDACSGAHVYVVCPDNLTVTWRGHDWFGKPLVRAINTWEQRRMRESGWGWTKEDVVKLGCI